MRSGSALRLLSLRGRTMEEAMKSVSDLAQTITGSLKRLASRFTGWRTATHAQSSGQGSASTKVS